MAASMKNKLKLICRISLYDSVRHIRTGLYVRNDLMNSKTMKKIMKKANRRTDQKFNTVNPVYEQSILNAAAKGRPIKSNRKFSDGMQRRANYVGEILYESVCQILGSGELGVTATVTKVKVIPDMAHMNVYWECSGNKERDTQTQIALSEKAKQLRHYLIDAQTLGHVPLPVFVKDLSVARQRQVDEILYKLSLESSAEAHNLETDAEVNDSESNNFTLNASEISYESDSDNTSQQILHETANGMGKEVNVDGDENEEDKNDPNFRQNLYGLQHDALMKKVISAKQSAIQRPSIVSSMDSLEGNFRKFDLKVKSKLLNMQKPISKKKLQRQIEREHGYIFELERDTSNEVGLKDDLDNEEELEYDYSAIDEYMEKFSKDKQH